MSDEIIAAVIGLVGILIGALGTLVVQRVVFRQKAHELFLTSLEHLGGGSQERNLGISALEFYWKDYASEKQLIVPVLVGAAIYLLTESEQGDAQHERYNLKRIMSLLDRYLCDLQRRRYRLQRITHFFSNKFKIHIPVSYDPVELEWFRDLHKALCDWDPERRKIKAKNETKTRGLLIDKDQRDLWKNDLEEKIPTLKSGTE
jgi:hypothetical protein